MTGFQEMLSGYAWLITLIILLGMIMLILEIVTPNFGFVGLSGAVLLFAGVGMTSLMVSFQWLIAIIAIILVVITLTLILTYRSATKGGGISRTLVLKTTEAKDKGYVGVDELKELIGMEGIALTQLRPAGTAEIRNKRIDVVTEGEFIPKGSKIKVIDVEGYKTVVIRSED